MSLIDRMRPRQGLKVLVTAGASGIGAAITEGFLDAGARVHICDVDEDALTGFCDEHRDVSGSLADVSSEADVEKLFSEVKAKLGGLDVLVNNAGISGPTAPVEEMNPQDWQRTIDVDLVGQFLTTRLAVPMLRESNHAGIINLSSVAGRLGYALRTPYAAAKWGVVGYTASLAKELGPDGIQVNAILPGVVRGKRIEAVIQGRADAMGLSYEETEKRYLQMVSLRRMVEPEDIAAMALFLSSPAGANISGQALSVCGNVENL